MIGTLTSIVVTHAIEITCSSIFLGGFGTYQYVKYHSKSRKQKMVFWNVTNRVVKAKKAQQQLNARCGGNGKNDNFFKAS